MGGFQAPRRRFSFFSIFSLAWDWLGEKIHDAFKPKLKVAARKAEASHRHATMTSDRNAMRRVPVNPLAVVPQKR
ncbi:MAG: hypothetical protein V3W37_06400 [Candidatus Binatia bacterium]